MSLDDPLKAYLSESARKHAPSMIGQLASHNADVRHQRDAPGCLGLPYTSVGRHRPGRGGQSPVSGSASTITAMRTCEAASCCSPTTCCCSSPARTSRARAQASACSAGALDVADGFERVATPVQGLEHAGGHLPQDPPRLWARRCRGDERAGGRRVRRHACARRADRDRVAAAELRGRCHAFAVLPAIHPVDADDRERRPRSARSGRSRSDDHGRGEDRTDNGAVHSNPRPPHSRCGAPHGIQPRLVPDLPYTSMNEPTTRSEGSHRPIGSRRQRQARSRAGLARPLGGGYCERLCCFT